MVAIECKRHAQQHLLQSLEQLNGSENNFGEHFRRY